MARLFVTPIDMNQNEVRNMRLQNLGVDPGSPVEGQIWYRSDTHRPMWRNGSTNNAIYPFDSSNTVNTGVLRDGSGNFSAGTITANLTGTASQASTLDDGTTTFRSGSYYLSRTNHTGTQTASTISDFNTAVRLNRLDQMAAPTASVSMNSQRLTNLLDPISDQDAATKAYVDASGQGLDIKNSCRVATSAALPTYTFSTTGGGTLTATSNGAFPTIDGVTLAVGESILVKDETLTSAPYNGIYTLTQVGDVGTPWILVRRVDANASAKVTSGLYTYISEGTNNGGNGYVLSTPDPITLNTDALDFTQFSGAGQIIAGNGLSKVGNTLSVNASTRFTFTSGKLDIGSTIAVTDASNLWTVKQTFVAPDTGTASINLPAGTAPSAPANGDMWTTSTGFYVQVNGTTLSLTSATGTVISVGLSLPSIFTVTGSPVTTSGTLTATLASQTANTVFAAPSGSAGAPSFRALVDADIPSLPGSIIGSGTVSSTYLPSTIAYTNVANTFIAKQTFVASTTTEASINIPNGVAPTTPVNGDIWADSLGNLLFRKSSSTDMFAVFRAPITHGVNQVLFTNSTSRPLISSAASFTYDYTTASMVVGSTTQNASITVKASAGYTRMVQFSTGSNRRWALGASNDAESGSDAGSSFALSAYNDSGTLIDTPITIARAAGGAITIARPTSITAKLSTAASTASSAGLVIPHGNAPSSPVDGDVWTTTAGFFVRVNGATLQLGTGTGTVQSVGLSLPSIFTVSDSPVTTTGTLTGTLATQTANRIFAGPSSGVDAVPTFRAMVPLDLATTPSANQILQASSSTTMAWVTVTGDASMSGGTLALATVNSNVGSWGSASAVATFTVNAKGLITAAGQTNIQIAQSQVTNLSNDLAAKLALAGGTMTGKLNLAASAAGGAGINFGVGTAPSTPINGDMWVTSTGAFLQVNGSTFQIGNGTVTSVALSLPSIFSVSGSPVTTSGTLTATLASQAVNTVFAGPDSGGSGTPSFRALVDADIPSTLSANARVAVSLGGTAVGTRRGINFIQGSGVTLNVVDNSGSERVDVTISATGTITRYATSIGDGTTTAFTITHSLGTKDVVIRVFDNATGAEVEPDVVHTSTTQATITFAVAPSNNAYRVVVLG